MKSLNEIPQSLSGALRALGFLTLVALLTPVALAWKRVRPRDPFAVPQFFHRCVLRLLGIEARVYGLPCSQSPVLFVANHASYLDIIVLGALLPAAFVAKSEVSGWPLFGFLSRVQNTVFIERRSTRAAEQRTQLQDHLAKKQDLILFPEGTSSDGLTVLPFKSSLFSIVEDEAAGIPVTVQPVSITCTGIDGFPMLREERPLYAWYGDMTLPPHLWSVFRRGRFTLDVIFHTPIPPGEAANRKALASACQSLVARGIEQSLTGRIDTPRLLITKK